MVSLMLSTVKSASKPFNFSLDREANICSKCWLFMTVAIKIVDKALEGKRIVFTCAALGSFISGRTGF